LSMGPEISDVPYAQLSMLSFFASEEAQAIQVWQKGSLKYSDTEQQLKQIKAFDVREHLSSGGAFTEKYLICIKGMCHSYLITQLGFKGHLTPLHVDFELLKAALDRSMDDRIELYADPESSKLISIADVVSRLGIRGSTLKYANEIDPLRVAVDDG